MNCPSCGHEIEPSEEFCKYCGSMMSRPRTTSTQGGKKRPTPPPQPPFSGGRNTEFPWKWIVLIVAIVAAAIVSVVLITHNSDQGSGSATVVDTAFQNGPSGNQPTAANSPVPMLAYEWLEDQPDIETNRINFVPEKWDNQPFMTSSKRYNHGVCITMKGSKFERILMPSEGSQWTEPYNEVFLDVAFGGRFIKMTFDIGFEKTYPARWGAPDTNGSARLILTDAGSGRMLYDTGIVNHSFFGYDIAVDTTDVQILRITYQVSPAAEKPTSALNLLLGEALMYKYGAGYDPTMAYIPKLSSPPKDYREYEARATDRVEQFILLGYRERYAKEEFSVFSREEMELILNGMYAMSGKLFGEADLWEYFTSKTWYCPVKAMVNDEMNNVQSDNLDIIVAYMKELGWR